MARGRVRNDNSLLPWIAAGVVLSLVMGVGAYLFFREPRPARPPGPAAFEPMTSYTGPRLSVTLYFPSEDDGYLRPEKREVRLMAEEPEQVREVVGELIRGPMSGLVPSFPAEARVKSVFIDDSGTAYINFSRELQTGFPGGAWTETLTIYSLTNTLTANFSDIKAVQLLIEGFKVDTLAGHIDTSMPFTARPALNRG